MWLSLDCFCWFFFVFVVPHTSLKTNAAMNLRAAWSWPPTIMFPVEKDAYHTLGKQSCLFLTDDLDTNSATIFLEINMHI